MGQEAPSHRIAYARLCRVAAREVSLDLVPCLVPGGEDFLCVFKPGRHGSDAPPLHPASARRELPLQTQ
jgi:hypothetical protein